MLSSSKGHPSQRLERTEFKRKGQGAQSFGRLERGRARAWAWFNESAHIGTAPSYTSSASSEHRRHEDDPACAGSIPERTTDTAEHARRRGGTAARALFHRVRVIPGVEVSAVRLSGMFHRSLQQVAYDVVTFTACAAAWPWNHQSPAAGVASRRACGTGHRALPAFRFVGCVSGADESPRVQASCGRGCRPLRVDWACNRSSSTLAFAATRVAPKRNGRRSVECVWVADSSRRRMVIGEARSDRDARHEQHRISEAAMRRGGDEVH